VDRENAREKTHRWKEVRTGKRRDATTRGGGAIFP
jgi:hypothetical protein